MRGILYGVGAGPGDPELLTLKAVRLIEESDVIAFPGAEPEKTAAYGIAVRAVPGTAEKELLGIHMPMTSDPEETQRAHREGASRIEARLDEGKDVAFVTLGDVSLYSTFSYIQRIVEADGYTCELVSGIPSFCAAAAELKVALGLRDEPIHIYPAADRTAGTLPERGTVILMKSGSRMGEAKELLRRSGRDAVMVENCGMEDERIYHSLDEIPDSAGYFTLVISAGSD